MNNTKRKSCHVVTGFSLWLGWRDSNPRMTESKSVALPLGDSPIYYKPDWQSFGVKWGGMTDSNRRSPVPQTGALTNYANPTIYAPNQIWCHLFAPSGKVLLACAVQCEHKSFICALPKNVPQERFYPLLRARSPSSRLLALLARQKGLEPLWRAKRDSNP